MLMGIPRHNAGWPIYLVVKTSLGVQVVGWVRLGQLFYTRQLGVISDLGKECVRQHYSVPSASGPSYVTVRTGLHLTPRFRMVPRRQTEVSNIVQVAPR